MILKSPVSVIIPTYNRAKMLKVCLEKILSCSPLPTEIIVHIDAGDADTMPMLAVNNFPLTRWISSETTQGPGGGRNQLLKEAKYSVVTSFDDDSWPISADYFQIAIDTFHKYPQAAVLSSQEIRKNSPKQLDKSINTEIREVSCFQNCACLMRREAFLQTSGYIPLRYAYGMEEADVALQLLDKGWQILDVPSLQVFHDTHLEHHQSPEINAAHIANTALLAYLRYPVSKIPLGIAQVLNRVKYAYSMRRYQGIGKGLLQIPQLIWQYRHLRSPVQLKTLTKSRQLGSTK
jgi:GT2 family glycosyltransferase